MDTELTQIAKNGIADSIVNFIKNSNYCDKRKIIDSFPEYSLRQINKAIERLTSKKTIKNTKGFGYALMDYNGPFYQENVNTCSEYIIKKSTSRCSSILSKAIKNRTPIEVAWSCFNN